MTSFCNYDPVGLIVNSEGRRGPNLASPHGIKLTTPGVKTGIDILTANISIFSQSNNRKDLMKTRL